MAYIPLMIDISGKTVIVVGGGKVAERRVDTMIKYGADIHVISPEVTDGLYSLYEQGEISWNKRIYDTKDAQEASLIIAATNNPEVNSSVKQNAPANALLNMAGEAEAGDVIFPGTLHRGRMTISVSTGGASPGLVSSILKDLDHEYDNNYEAYVDFLYECRKWVKHSTVMVEEKNRLLKDLLSDEYLNAGRQQEVLDWLKSHD
ncbi:NAD(P)-binding protein [Salinicoccus sp. HZC-1]|uniref:NAD(P)-binding protein n=1 Tax=Salinicoccus sp. HZC-1 TaxID=3385497 RepID=UPI00398B161D